MSGSGIPALSLYSAGVGVYPSAWANTVVQGGCLLANLQMFSGIAGMTVYMVGTNSTNDGGQGTFVWVGGVGTDDGGVTIIVPYGSSDGFWERSSSAGSEGPPGPAGPQGTTGPAGPQGAAGSATPALASISALRAANTGTLNSPIVWVEGYSAATDGGEGMFWLSSNISLADNGGTVIVDASSRRWFREKQSGPLMLSWFGGTPASADCSPALVLALAALPSPGGEIHLSAGQRIFGSNVTYTYPSGAFSVTITGEGSDNTVLLWPGNGGITLNASNFKHSIHVRDLTIRAGTLPSMTNGILLNQSAPGGNFAQNDIVRVTFDGTSASNSFNWAISVSAWCNINYDAVLIYSANVGGIQLAGNPAVTFNYSIIHNVDRCGFYGCATGIQYGSYTQGLTVSQCNFVNGINGIIVPSGSVGALSQLVVTASEFTLSGSAVLIQAQIFEVQIFGCLIIVGTNANGILISGIIGYSTFIGNVFVTTGVDANSGGIVVSTGVAATDSIISGNTFNALSTGILLGSGTQQWNVQSNHYSNCSTNVVNNGTANTIGGGSP